MIILVTGSRDWPVADRQDVWTFLMHYWKHGCPEGVPFTVRHGKARGVDTYASQWVTEMRTRLEDMAHLVTEDPWPVSPEAWRANPHRAGHLRNEDMVDAEQRPDFCLGFSYRGSGGTKHCYDYARAAGIDGRLVTWEEIHVGDQLSLFA